MAVGAERPMVVAEMMSASESWLGDDGAPENSGIAAD